MKREEALQEVVNKLADIFGIIGTRLNRKEDLDNKVEMKALLMKVRFIIKQMRGE